MPIVGFVLYFGLPILLQSLLLYLLLGRNALHDNAWFFIYTVFSIAATITRLVVFQNTTIYFYLYWGSEVIYAVLQLLASYEIWESMFRYYFRFWWVKSLFPVTVLVALSIAILRTASPHTNLDVEITRFVLAFEFGVRLIQGAFFVLLWFLVWLTGIRWRQYALGISTGFGMQASFVLLASFLRSEFGTGFNSLFIFGTPVAYIVTLLIWLWYYSSPQPPDPERDLVPPLSSEDLAKYLAAIRRIRGS
jgi:hypothetical protein